MSNTQTSLGHVLVTGGCGFLGHHMVSQLLERAPSTKITVLDINTSRNRNSSPNVSYQEADFTDTDATKELFKKLRPDVVVHTASPPFDVGEKLLYKVNVEGTKSLLDAAKEAEVKVFVYTSSASVVWNWSDPLINVDERWPTIAGKEQPDYYTSTKAWAEVEVLGANRTQSSSTTFLTAAIRPAGIFGEDDSTVLPNMVAAYRSGKTKFQVGDNTNLFDFTYVGNVAHGHILCIEALLRTHSMSTMPLDTEKVDGEAFFVTNDQPTYFWDFSRTVWKECGDTTRIEDIWKMSPALLLPLASLVEFIYWLFRLGKPNLSRQKLYASTMVKYYNIDKAKARLKYFPIVTIREGLRRSVKPILKAQEEAEQRAKEKKSQ